MGRLLGITGHKVQFEDLVGLLLYGRAAPTAPEVRKPTAPTYEGMARILNYEYDGLGRRIGMSTTFSGNTRCGYSGLGAESH